MDNNCFTKNKLQELERRVRYTNVSEDKDDRVETLKIISDISKITLIHSDNDVHSLREIFNLFD